MTRTSRITHILVILSIAALTLIGMSSAAHAHAAPASSRSATYVAPDGSYHFAYPATWTRRYPQQGIDILLVAPDRNVVVMAFSVAGTSGDLKGMLGSFVKDLRATLDTVRYSTYRYSDGNSLFVAYALVRFQDGRAGIVAMEFVRVGARMYMLTGVIPNMDAATWKHDADQLVHTLASFSVAPSSSN